MVEDKSQVIEEVSEKKEKDDLAVPNWPKYQDPVGQRAEIDKELNKVQKQANDFKKSSEAAEAQLKSTESKSGKSDDFAQKQKEIDLQHKSTVNKIKSEIWGDRISFLQKIINLSEESKQDIQESRPKVQALAQESTRGKTQEDEDSESLAQKTTKTKSKKKTDLLHRIDSQLQKLKGKKKDKMEARTQLEEEATEETDKKHSNKEKEDQEAVAETG